jgi:hypothetical protein
MDRAVRRHIRYGCSRGSRVGGAYSQGARCVVGARGWCTGSGVLRSPNEDVLGRNGSHPVGRSRRRCHREKRSNEESFRAWRRHLTWSLQRSPHSSRGTLVSRPPSLLKCELPRIRHLWLLPVPLTLFACSRIRWRDARRPVWRCSAAPRAFWAGSPITWSRNAASSFPLMERSSPRPWPRWPARPSP